MPNKSTTVAVTDLTGYVVSAANLAEGEQIEIMYVACVDCDGGHEIPFSPCGTPMFIDEFYNPVVLDIPGQYRLTSTMADSTALICTKEFKRGIV